MNILLTSVGRRAYMIKYFKEAQAGQGSVFVSNSMYTAAMQYANGYVLTPNIYDGNYIDFLIGYCKENKIGALISLFDIDLPVLSAHKSVFEQNGIRVLVSSPKVTEICNDKWKTYLFVKGIGLPQPRTYINLEEAVSDARLGVLSYPVYVKPRWGMGSLSLYKADNEEELKVFYRKVKREVFDSYLKYESNQTADCCVLIQEKMKGQEHGMDVFNDFSGNLVAVVAKRKDAMRAGETDIATIVDSSKFLPLANLLSNKLGHVLDLDVDCFVNGDDIYVLEMNCRFGGQYPFSHLAGVDFPKQIIKWLNNEETDDRLLIPKIGTIGAKELVPVKI
ncbi:MAG: ATP-grasp domain-containing protein [Bacteroidales bacterium]|nr:ATP-grasp domain-containing protein [Bacteroidales bacterium]